MSVDLIHGSGFDIARYASYLHAHTMRIPRTIYTKLVVRRAEEWTADMTGSATAPRRAPHLNISTLDSMQ
jgi:hypothetical protein